MRGLTDRVADQKATFRAAIEVRREALGRAFSPLIPRVPQVVVADNNGSRRRDRNAAMAFAMGASATRLGPGPNIRRTTRIGSRAVSTAEPAQGSMGIVDSAIGEARIQAEIATAVAGHGTLSIIRVLTTLYPFVDPIDISRAGRAVARAIDSSIGEHDVAYANGPNDFVVILPDADASAAALVAKKIASGANNATVLIGQDRRRRRFAELGSVRISPSTIADRLAA
jgi:hypothetical protein